MKRWIWGSLGTLAAIVVVALLALGFWPVAPDVATIGEGGKAGAPAPPDAPDLRGTGQVIVVSAGESIQDAIDAASPGDTVRVRPGVYNETLLVDIDSLTLEGVVEDGERATLDGQDEHPNGVMAIGDYFTVSGFRVVNYTSNGILVQGVTGAIFRDLITDKTGEYGLFPILTSDILIEQCVTSGVSDTGIYVGQSRGVVVRDNEAFGNVSGIEIENSVDALVENNYTHDNTAGILVFILPGKTATEASDTRVVNNRIENNNLANFARPENVVSLVPYGSGIMIIGADRTEITGNTFSGNKSFAVGIVALTDFPEFFGESSEWDIPVLPEENWIHDNVYVNNGNEPDPVVIEVGFIGADLLWSTAGAGNRWDEPGTRQFPPMLPSSTWPEFLQRAYWRVVNFAAHL